MVRPEQLVLDQVGQVRRIANLNCSITEIAARWSAGALEADLRSWAACTHLSDDAATPTPATRME